MYPNDKNGFLRKVSLKLLLKPCLKSGLSANTLTVLNFSILGCGAVVCFIMGKFPLGLLLCTLNAMVDYCDGEVARVKGQTSEFGKWLDTSLDWLWLMLLIGAISYAENMMTFGYISLVAITYGNYLDHTSKADFEYPWYLSIGFFIILGVIFNLMNLAIIAIMATQLARVGILFQRAIESGKAGL